MRAQAGDDDPRPVMHLEWNLLDPFATVLVLCANTQPVRSILDAAGIERNVGGQLLVDDGLGVRSGRDAWQPEFLDTRLAAATRVSRSEKKKKASPHETGPKRRRRGKGETVSNCPWRGLQGPASRYHERSPEIDEMDRC